MSTGSKFGKTSCLVFLSRLDIQRLESIGVNVHLLQQHNDSATQ